MSFGEKLKFYRERADMTQKEVAKHLGIQAATYSGYEIGRREPDVEKIKALASLFGVSGDELLEIKKPEPDTVSREELQKIKKYRALDTHGRKVVDGVLDMEYDRMTHIEAPKQQGWVTSIKLYDLALSAGPGEPWTGDARASIRLELPTEQVPENAHFCARVNGNSMEPAYMDGDIVFVQRVEGSVREGEVGVFYLNGDGYVKRLGDHCLESNNPDYPPIPIHDFDDLRCQGRVLGKVKKDKK